MQYIFQKPRIQIQHLLKLNIMEIKNILFNYSIQIQHLLKLNEKNLAGVELNFADSNTTLVKVK